MSTVIDSLVVELGLDNTLFKKRLKETEKDMDQHGIKYTAETKKRVELERREEREKQSRHKEQLHRNREELDGFHKLRNETLALLAIFTAGRGLVSFIEGTINTGVALAHMSENVDVSVDKLAGWQFAMQEVGGTAEAASSMIDKAAMAAASFKTGIPNEARLGLMRMAGFAGVDISGASKGTEGVLFAQAKIVQALIAKRGEPAALEMSREWLHITTEEFNLLKKGNVEVEKRVLAGAAISGWTKKQTKEAERAKFDWLIIDNTLGSIGRQILFKILMPMEKLASLHTKDITKFINDFKKGIDEIAPEALDAVGVVLQGIVIDLKFAVWVVERLKELGIGIGEGVAQLQTGNFTKEHGSQFEMAYQAARANNFENNKSSSVYIQSLTITTLAKDAAGIAKGIHAGLQDAYQAGLDATTPSTQANSSP